MYNISPQQPSELPPRTRRSASGPPAHPSNPRATSQPANYSTRNHSHHHRHHTLSMVPSSSSPSSSSSPPRTGRTATKIMSSVRRSFSVVTSPKKRQTSATAGMLYSTPEEHDSYAHSRFLAHDTHDSQAPPTVEQIAMGLHVSRTPHLRQYPYSQRHHPSSTPLHPHPHHNPNSYHNHPYLTPADPPSRRPSSSTTLPPPPTRSSLKKSSTLNSGSSPRVTNPGFASVASGSSTTITSNSGPSTPHSNRSLTSLKLRMSRFLPGLRIASPSSSTESSISSSPRNSSEYHVVKKAVRFSTNDDI
ncbi:hypothetical protein BDN72DRAFT_832712 [Pluteus cervinus]|uniref:Uncharacterized protein n=1 Tax=Pluteus cervinus TaxID=181527 RepID=A0ACD3BDD3_9AGAR|nr:hypothetical protein BDN72DRAFT_832712 [Pluteus cervinus]